MNKAVLRDRIRASRRARSAGARAVAGVALAQGVMALPEIAAGVAAGRPVALYLSMPTEPSTVALLGALRRAGSTTVVPRIAGLDLAWVRVDEGSVLRRSAHGMDEPVGPSLGSGGWAVAECAAIIVPALAVDPAGQRLGQGGGFYDRTLAHLPDTDRPPLVALVFDDEVVDEVPTEDHDLRVDVVVTPKRTVRVHTPASQPDAGMTLQWRHKAAGIG